MYTVAFALTYTGTQVHSYSYMWTHTYIKNVKAMESILTLVEYVLLLLRPVILALAHKLLGKFSILLKLMCVIEMTLNG